MRLAALLFLSSSAAHAATSRYFSGSFPPYPACSAQYNAPCSPANAYGAVGKAVDQLLAFSSSAAVEAWLQELNNGGLNDSSGAKDSFGFGPMVVSVAGKILADPENPTLAGKELDDLLLLQNAATGCNQTELRTSDCARVSMTIFQEDLLTRWIGAAAGDGWTNWVWTRSGATENAVGTVVPEKKVGHVRRVSTALGDLLVASSFSDRPLASSFAMDKGCSSHHDELCSVELSRMLVGDGLTKMMMASTEGELARVFYDITFTDTYKAGSGFYIFVVRFGPPGSPGGRGECVAHGWNSGHVGQTLPQVFLKVNVTGVDAAALHGRFIAAAEDGGGWVAYEWRSDPNAPIGYKIAFIAGVEKFGTKYYLGVGFDHRHAAVAKGPHCSTCSAEYSYFCAIRNTHMLMGHVQAFLLTDVSQALAWSSLTTSKRDDEALVRMTGKVEDTTYKFDGGFYSFVYDFNGTSVAHGENGAFVGRTLWGILKFTELNKECDDDDLNCNITAVDGWQLNEDFKNAAAGGGGWVKYGWRSGAGDPAHEKVAYLVKISKYGRSFYAGVGYTKIKWAPEAARGCNVDFSGTCSEDNVLAIVGHMASEINNAQDESALSVLFGAATSGTADEFHRPGGFHVEVYDEAGGCVAHGRDAGLVGKSLENIFLELGSKLLGAEQYFRDVQAASHGAFFTYQWQAGGMEEWVVRKAFAQKATYKPLRSQAEEAYYIVSSFVDAEMPPKCTHDANCTASAACVGGSCTCKAGTKTNFSVREGSCGVEEGCVCQTQDYELTCVANPCPAGKFGASKGACQDCQPGKYSEADSMSDCTMCRAGAYQDEPGKTSCKDCAAGKSINARGSTECEDCAQGWFQAQRGAAVCNKCQNGKFAEGTQNTDCESCPMEHETTFDRAAVSKWECVCEEGTYRGMGHSREGNGSHQPCFLCPKGMECVEGNQAPLLEKGFWAQDDDDRDYSVFRCRDVKECPGGPAGTCAAGREGVGCASCMPNHQADQGNGQCEKCGGLQALPVVLTIALVITGMVAMATYAKIDVSRVRLNTLAVGICIGQTAVAVQALAAFKVLDVDWVEPIRSFLRVVSVLSFDLDVLRISCMFADSKVLGKYLLKLLIFPTGVAVLCLIFFVMQKVFKDNVTVDHVVNSVGLLFLVMFLTLAMLSLVPFHCISSPNGSMSLASNPSVICVESGTWKALVALGAVAVLCYVVMYIAWVTYVTWRYPRLITAGNGMAVINRYRFLFQRFTVACYFFTPIYLGRNFIITILPVAFADHGHRQVFWLSFVLMFFGFLQAWLKPWRGFLPNLLDTITTCCLILALVGAALLNNVDFDQVVLDMQVFFSIIITVACVATFGFMAFMMWRRVMPSKSYAALLCHHKAGCAVGARLVKLELEQRLKKPVFLDSDELDNLEELLDVVRASIGNLVVLLTAGTLSRPWCAGEIATAVKNGVPLVPVAYDDYQELTEEDVTEEAICNRWQPESFAPCVAQGVSLGSVAEAYACLRNVEKIMCPRISACMSGNPEAVMRSVDMIAARCMGLAESSSSASVPMVPSSAPASDSQDLQFATLASYSCGEAISAARVLSRLVRSKTQWRTAELLHPREVQQVKSRSDTLGCLCVILTEGCLTSAGFPNTLMVALEAWPADTTFLTVRMTGFEYPIGQMLKESIEPQVARLLSKSTEEVAQMHNKLLSVLSAPFSPHQHISVLEVEVDGIVRRIESERRRKTAGGARGIGRATTVVSSPGGQGDLVALRQLAEVAGAPQVNQIKGKEENNEVIEIVDAAGAPRADKIKGEEENNEKIEVFEAMDVLEI